MKKYVIGLLFILLIVIIYYLINGKEQFYDGETYVNTPSNYGIYYTRPPLKQIYQDPYLSQMYLNPVPINTIRWNSGIFNRPMLTSIESPYNNILGQQFKRGIAYTLDNNDNTIVDIYQINLDPQRELYNYFARTKYNQTLSIELPYYKNYLEDGDIIKIKGLQGKGDFIFEDFNKYQYIYI